MPQASNSEWGQAGHMLQALSAGLQGRGAQFNQQQLNERAFEHDQLEAKRRADIERQKTVFTDSLAALNFASMGRFDQVVKLGQSRMELSPHFPDADFKDTETLTQMAQMAADGNSEAAQHLVATLENNVEIGRGLGIIEPVKVSKEGMASAKTHIFDNGTVLKVLPDGKSEVTNPAGEVVTGKDRTEALKIARREQIRFAGDEAAAKEGGKLGSQLRLKPEVEAAVTSAVRGAAAMADIDEAGRSNELALNVYTTAMTGLANALGDTTTGPIAGWSPALTANQQIADGAIAAMAPILKQMFRSAGEGNFTDSDQKILMDMIPTRKDSPEARMAKLANIDAIVNAKLGGAAKPNGDTASPQVTAPHQKAKLPETNQQGWVLSRDGAGNQAYVGPNGEIEEVR